MANFHSLTNDTWIKVAASSRIVDLYFYNKFNVSYYCVLAPVDTLIGDLDESTQMIIDASQQKRFHFGAPVDVWVKSFGGTGNVRVDILPDLEYEMHQSIGQPNGIAQLDEDGNIPLDQLPPAGDLGAHTIAEMPHQYTVEGVTYRYGMTMVDGFPAMVYEEI